MLLDIVILPPALIRAKVGKFARTLAKSMPVRYVIDNHKLIPHVSLFHINISKNRLDKLIDVVKKISLHIKPFKIIGGKINVGTISLEINFKKSKQIRLLNKKVVNSCSRLRTGKMPWMLKRKPIIDEKKLIRRYGTYGTIGKNFEPHITLLVKFLKKENIFKPPSVYTTSFIANNITICQVNYWHQVTKIIKQFKVK
ncbi:MAG: hypothetical protein ABIJ81_04375 [Patescibacteria group bacterium]